MKTEHVCRRKAPGEMSRTDVTEGITEGKKDEEKTGEGEC